MLNELNRHYGIAGSINFVHGQGGLTKAIIRSGNAHQAEVYLYGATITSWKNLKGKELLYLSPKADFTGTKPIRGGIPLVFPQFGTGPLPAHGVARILNWTPCRAAALPSGETELSLTLSDSSESHAIWNQRFTCEFSIILSDKLRTIFKVTNNSDSEFLFQNALHTYFAISDINQVEIHNLEDLDYLDSTKNRIKEREARDVITFTSETDRIYLNAPNEIIIRDNAAASVISISKANMSDAVVWNAWIDRCKAITDLPDDAYQRYVCVESGNVTQPIKLPAHASWSCEQVLSES